MGSHSGVVVGIDNGGTKTNATVLEVAGNHRFLVDRMHEVPSRVAEGPAAAIEAMVDAMDRALAAAGVESARVVAVGLDTPGPASAEGVISSKGATNYLNLAREILQKNSMTRIPDSERTIPIEEEQ